MLTARVIGDAQVVAHVSRMTADLLPNVVRKAEELGVGLEAHIKRDYLSGQVLHVRSGQLRNSIHHETALITNGVQERVYSAGVPYAAIQNYGGHTSAHMIYPRTAQALAFTMGGRTVFAKAVHHPGSYIKARPYMEPALEDYRVKIIEGFQQVTGDLIA